MEQTWREALKQRHGRFDSSDEIVLDFGDQPAEYEAARRTIGLADVSSESRIELTGGDRKKFLHNLCTNEIHKLPAGSGCEAFFLDAKGRIIDYVVVYQGADSIWLDAAPGRAKPLLAHLDRYLIREDVGLHDRTEELGQFHVVGPRATELLARLGGPTEPEPSAYSHGAFELEDIAVQWRHRPRSQQPGYDLVFPVRTAPVLWETLLNRGSDLGIRPIGANVLETLRIEAGLPALGKEISDANFPQEMDRNAQAISFTKGCYIGQETVARIDSYGHVNKVLRGLILESARPASAGTPIRQGEKVVGEIASSVFSPAFGKAIGLAVLRTGADKPGTELTVTTESGTVTARVSALPFGIRLSDT